MAINKNRSAPPSFDNLKPYVNIYDTSVRKSQMTAVCALGYKQAAAFSCRCGCAATTPSRFALGRRPSAHTFVLTEQNYNLINTSSLAYLAVRRELVIDECVGASRRRRQAHAV